MIEVLVGSVYLEKAGYMISVYLGSVGSSGTVLQISAEAVVEQVDMV